MLIRKRVYQTKLKIDFHTHILPGIDDGSKSSVQSIQLLTAAKKAGFNTVIATPHFYPHRYNVREFLQKRDIALSKIAENSDIPNIICGAEVLLCEGIEDMHQLESLCIGNSDTMLIELPFDESAITDRMYETIENMINRGFNIVLAHPNRYSNNVVENLISIGAYLQINVSHICTYFERRRIMQWLNRNCVYAIGSDIHRSTKVYDELKRAEHYLAHYINDINNHSEKLLSHENLF